MDEEQSQVITLGRASHESGHLLFDALQMIVGRFPGVQGLHHPVFSELFLLIVLGFREAVSIEEQSVVILEDSFLLYVFHPGNDSEWKVGLYRQGLYGIRECHRRIVTRVAVAQMPVGQVQYAAEERDEHVVLVHC